MTNRFYITLLTLFILAACGKKEAPKESLEFTKEKPTFTGDRSMDLQSAIQLTDITKEAGIDFHHVTGAFGQKWMPETIGSGGGFLDYDNDGLPDILLINSKEWKGHETGLKSTPKLYRNKGDGTFEDVTNKAGLTFSIYGMGSSFADFDADGDMDIYITAVGDNLLLRNDNRVFKNVTDQFKVDGNDPTSDKFPAWSTGSAWIDVDKDGWLDLFVANYVKWTPETDIYITRDGKNKSYATPDVYHGESCRLYKNVNGKTFVDITEKAGLLNHEGKSLGVAVADFNHDTWPDMVISNDTQPNFLYMNNGDGTFTNKAIIAGIGYDENGRARAGMGIDVADVANDNKLAIVIGNFSQEPLSLYTQTGSGELFSDRAGATRLASSSLLKLTFGLQFCDFDKDGYLELIAANGHIEPQINAIQKDVTFAQPPQLFYNIKGKFVDISSQLGESFNEPIVGRGIATADIDKDGDLDILITVNGDSPKLFRNDTENSFNFIGIQLKGQRPNLQAIGANIDIYYGGQKQSRMVRTGSSYLAQSDVATTLFGLGENTKIDSLVITWPTKDHKTTVTDLAVNEYHVVKE